MKTGHGRIGRCCSGMIAAASLVLAAAAPLRIMPFGDSITAWDCRSNAYTSADDRPIFNPLNETAGSSLYPAGTYFVSAQGGYRGLLGARLGDPTWEGNGGSGAGAAAGAGAASGAGAALSVPWSFVGSNFLCGAHEGYAGETVEWLANRTTAIVSNAQPDIVLFQAGTNDLFWAPPRGTRDPAALAARLRVLLDRAFGAAPTATFLLSTVTRINATRCATYSTARWRPPNCPGDMPANIEAYNALLPGVTAEYRAKGFDIALHDVNAEARWGDADYWIWGIHFNVTGFDKMAASWASAIGKSAPWRRALAQVRLAISAGAR